MYQDYKYGRWTGRSKIRSTEREALALIPTKSKDCENRTDIARERDLEVLTKFFPDFVVVV